MASIVNRKEHYLLRLLTLKIQVFKTPHLFFLSHTFCFLYTVNFFMLNIFSIEGM